VYDERSFSKKEGPLLQFQSDTLLAAEPFELLLEKTSLEPERLSV
jgi:hypothetical protein